MQERFQMVSVNVKPLRLSALMVFESLHTLAVLLAEMSVVCHIVMVFSGWITNDLCEC